MNLTTVETMLNGLIWNVISQCVFMLNWTYLCKLVTWNSHLFSFNILEWHRCLKVESETGNIWKKDPQWLGDKY